jgi:hypothetical protein
MAMNDGSEGREGSGGKERGASDGDSEGAGSVLGEGGGGGGGSLMRDGNACLIGLAKGSAALSAGDVSCMEGDRDGEKGLWN